VRLAEARQVHDALRVQVGARRNDPVLDRLARADERAPQAAARLRHEFGLWIISRAHEGG